MALLNRIRAASLVETLTASVIIVIVFMLASLSINNIFINSIERDEHQLQNRLRELRYFADKGRLQVPFHEEGEYWTIVAEKMEANILLHIHNKRKGEEYQIEIDSQ